jgi:excinuclease ABC subunit C
LDELGVRCDIAGLAKRDEEVWLPQAHEPIKLSRRSEALKVLQAVRDETHRFATNANQKLRSKDVGFKILESIAGIGPARAKELMRVFRNLPAIAAAETSEIASRCGLSVADSASVRAACKLAVQTQEKVMTRSGVL